MWAYIAHRNWKRVCDPHREINYDIVKEFYANAIKLIDETVAYMYQTYVRGQTILFGRTPLMSSWGTATASVGGEVLLQATHV